MTARERADPGLVGAATDTRPGPERRGGPAPPPPLGSRQDVAMDARDGELVDAHLQRVQHLLLPMVVRYEFGELGANPEGRAVLAAPPELRASLAIAALSGPRSGWTAAHVTEVRWSDQWPAELVRALNRRRIDWDPDAAALALRLVADADFDDERVQLVLKAADRIVDVHPGHPAVMDGLDRLDARVQATSTHRYRVPEMRARVVASIARHSPPDLLDLSPIADTDTWGPRARAVLAAADGRGADVRSLLGALTTAPSGSTPSGRWMTSLVPVLEPAGVRDVLSELVHLLVDLELDDHRPFVGAGNDSLARAAVWALGHDPVPPSDVDLLRDVVVRCSRTNGRPAATEALCGKAAGAAVAVLGRLRQEGGAVSSTAAQALDDLWATVDRGDVLRWIGRALELQDTAIAARVEEAKRGKAAATRARLDPDPAARASRLADVLDTDVAERLRRQGFDDRSRRAFRRHHPDRTEVVAISLAAAEVRLRFGVGFHRAGERPRWRIEDLDVAADLWLHSSNPATSDGERWLAHRATGHRDQFERRADRGRVDPVETLIALLDRFDAVALPALARWADPHVLADDLEDHEVPFAHGELLLGLDAPFATRRQATIRHLRALREEL